ncbi:sensor domain-containing protein [Noviherbaspirillum autotrophicum]|uniref:sensor domain-containing protein n=1 Tax=Noviherbaspirillum autotrophicum TaxID=709839 RepID=UPI0006935009|nr:diguanylate cyclase [Noviherbaspirillum autotrophicum]
MDARTIFAEREFLNRGARDIVNAIPAAFFVKDRLSRIILMNRACEEQWGIAFDDLYGTDGSGFFPPDQMEHFLEMDRHVWASRTAVDFEESYWNESLKENRVGNTSKRPVFDDDGTPLYLICITIDVTVQKHADAKVRASDAMLRGLFQSAPVGIVLTDCDGRFLEFNRAFELITGHTADELHALDYRSLTPPEYDAEDEVQLESLERSGSYGPYKKEYLRKDGERTPVRLTGVQIPGPGTQPCVWSLVEDITNARKLDESMKLASLIYLSSNEGIMVTDEENRILDVNPAFTRITGYQLDEIKGKNPKLMQSGLHNKEFYVQFWYSLNKNGCWQGEMWDHHKDGHLLGKWLNVSIIRSADGRVYRYVAQFSNITERRQQDELIWHQANYDQLTDIPNRRLFLDRLEHELKKAKRTGLPLAILFIDLDNFKEINDKLGHDKGDLLLKEAVRRIQRLIRGTDTFARLGGDEFTIIIPEYGGKETVDRIATEIVQDLRSAFELGGVQGKVSASIGITVYPSDSDNLQSLVKHADEAMYVAKMRGRDRFVYFSDTL